MIEPAHGAPGSKGWLVAAAAVHAFTALGIVCALMAMLAVLDQAFERAFFWLGVAFVIDGIDGTFARAVDVHRRLPRFSGEQLDLVVDYVTYVFVPVLLLHKAGVLAGAWGLMLAAAILLSSLFHFSDTESKSDDYCFVGFPAIWNIVAFFVLAVGLPGWASHVLIIVCVALTFVPMRWVHPMRVVHLRWLHLAVMATWAVAAAATLHAGFPAPAALKAIHVAVGLYGVGLALAWPWLRSRERARGG